MKSDIATLVDELISRYATVLDARDLKAWADLFAEDCSYAVYSAEDVERGLKLAYMLDDCRGRVLDRVKFVQDVWAGTVEMYRTRHVYQRTSLDASDSTQVRAGTNFLVAYTASDGVSGVLCSGRTEDAIVISNGVAKFRERRTLLDGIPARYLVYPV